MDVFPSLADHGARSREELFMDMHIADNRPLTGIDVWALPPAEGEAVLRRQLAAAYRLVDHFGWTELIYGHLTARVPGEANHFLINPFGLNYDEVTASNLVKIDLDGNIIGESYYPVNYAGFVIHSDLRPIISSSIPSASTTTRSRPRTW